MSKIIYNSCPEHFWFVTWEIVCIPEDVLKDCQKSGSIPDPGPTTGHHSNSFWLVCLKVLEFNVNIKCKYILSALYSSQWNLHNFFVGSKINEVTHHWL